MNAISFTNSRNSLFPVIMSALLVSFIGSLPPGTTNVLTAKFVVTDGSFAAVKFALGCMLAEACYAAAALLMMDRLSRARIFMNIVQWVSLFLLIALTVYSFTAAFSPASAVAQAQWTNGPVPFLISGFLLMIVNPVQLPFWMGWTTLFMERKLIDSTIHSFIGYVVGICLGSLLASIVFIFAGQYLAMSKDVSVQTLHIVVGAVFLITAVLQLIKMVRKQSIADRPAQHPVRA